MVSFETCKLFSALPPTEWQDLAGHAQARAFQAGQTIFQAGDPGDGLYIVGEGWVQVHAMVSPTEERVLSRIGPGDFFGEMAVLDNEPRSATVRAETDAALFFIPRETMLNRLTSSPRLAFSLVREFSLRLREFNRQYLQEVLQAERLALVGRFARSIVHDFKNPLAIISLASEMAASGRTDPARQEVAHHRIRKQVDRLSNMINELLEFTRGTQASRVLARTDYGKFMQQLLEEIRPELAEEKVTVVCETPPPTVALLLDPPRLTHVFYNLMHNAAEVMPNGGQIRLRFQLTENRVVTELEDSGPGIAPEIASRLFEPFATYGKSNGTGLGLSICKRIVEDHQGQIQAHNRPGGGAIFVLSLPRPAGPASA